MQLVIDIPEEKYEELLKEEEFISVCGNKWKQYILAGTPLYKAKCISGMNQKLSDLFLTALIQRFNEYQKDWLTNHNDIELEKDLEDLILRFLDDTSECFIREYTECEP